MDEMEKLQGMLEWLYAGVVTLTSVPSLAMTAKILGKAATMEIPIHRNGGAGPLPDDNRLEQDPASMKLALCLVALGTLVMEPQALATNHLTAPHLLV